MLYAITIGRLKSAASRVAVPLAIKVTSQAASAVCDWTIAATLGRGALGDGRLRIGEVAEIGDRGAGKSCESDLGYCIHGDIPKSLNASRLWP